MVQDFAKTPTAHLFHHILKFLSNQSLLLQHAKVTFALDIDKIFNKYIKINTHKSMKKILLGLLDAKINMLAFMQNAAQLLYSEQFLNPDYEGSLVFKRDEVRHIKSTSPHEFAEFKKLQETLR